MTEQVELPYRASRANLYHVPVKQWRKWRAPARQVFNEVYSAMNRSQRLFLHPAATPASRAHWRTTCWNAAWTSAGAAQGACGCMPLSEGEK